MSFSAFFAMFLEYSSEYIVVSQTNKLYGRGWLVLRKMKMYPSQQIWLGELILCLYKLATGWAFYHLLNSVHISITLQWCIVSSLIHLGRFTHCDALSFALTGFKLMTSRLWTVIFWPDSPADSATWEIYSKAISSITQCTVQLEPICGSSYVYCCYIYTKTIYILVYFKSCGILSYVYICINGTEASW